jgi:hypothetical protein
MYYITKWWARRSNGNNDDDAAIMVEVGVAGRGTAIIGHCCRSGMTMVVRRMVMRQKIGLAPQWRCRG